MSRARRLSQAPSGDWSEIKLGVFSDLVPGQDAAGRPALPAVRHSYAARRCWSRRDYATPANQT